MKIIFMGTPDLAKAALEAVYNHPEAEVAAVVTQPDRAKGRGMKMIPPPVKEFALEHDIPVYQPKTLRDGSFQEVLDEIQPEMIIVAAFGKILPPYILEYPKYGCICAHGSILPRFRGAAPIQRAIMEGEKKTGITAMYMDDGIDTGDMILTHTCEITEEDNFETVHDKLAVLAGRAMCDVIDATLAGTITRTPQPEEGSTYAKKIEKEDCIADFTKSPREMFNFIRGLSPMPYAMTKTPDGKLLKLCASAVVDGECDAPAGTVLELDTNGEGRIVIACGGGKIAVTSVVPEGKKRMPAADFIRGRKLNAGDVLAY